MLEAMDRDTWGGLPTRWYRQKGPYDTTTLAMHWDGTYRDRKWNEEGDFWADDEYHEDDDDAPDIASHLDHPTQSVLG